MIDHTQRPLSLKRWVLFTTYGWFLGILLVVGFAMMGEALMNMNDNSGSQAAVGMGMGAGVGFMQWIVLRKYANLSIVYFWCSFMGFSLAFLLRDVIDIYVLSNSNNVGISVEATIPAAVLLGAFLSAWLQYSYIFKNTLPRFYPWILINMVGWLLAAVITMSISMINFNLAAHLPKVMVVISAVLFLTVGGPILGYITGVYLLPRIKNMRGEEE